MSNYPDISDLIKLKNEWRSQRANRPITEKIKTVKRLRHLSNEIRKLTRTEKPVDKPVK